jgi:glucose-6-phosphate 1-dehydrogenase
MQPKKPDLEPAILVIFGITGDLAKRYLLPSLYHLIKDDMLHPQTEIIGITRGDMQLDDLLSRIELCVSEIDGICDPVAVEKLKSHLRIRQMDVTKSSEYDQLLTELNQIEDKYGEHMNRLYYLSIPPNVAEPIIKFMGDHNLNKSCQHDQAITRLLVEKPFGANLESAKALIQQTTKYFSENQIFRIDHYLAKETVRNILAFRSRDTTFEPIWNKKHIDHIEVIVNEKIGIENRINFYESTGALRDFIQSHLLQILSLVTMDQPSELTSEAIHASKFKLMQQLQQITLEQVLTSTIRGQYENYRQEVKNPNSNTETYAAIKTHISSPRWQDVPLIIRTGKCLTEKLSEVNVVFKPTKEPDRHNVLSFRIQPVEDIELNLHIKKPGYPDNIQPVKMNFDYESAFKNGSSPSAYEKVLIDAVRGDHTLFATSDEVLESWRIIQNIVDVWSKDSTGLEIYSRGSDGPDISKLYK